MSQNEQSQFVVSQTSTMALISLIMGILSWFVLPIIGAIVAVITGHLAKREIRESLGRLTGDGMATVGLVLGYLNLGLAILGSCAGVILFLLGLSPLLCLPFANEIFSFLANIIS